MPYRTYRRAFLACCMAVLAAGCTSAQLRRDTVSQMETVHELQQQQVLDNLAMFVHNRNSMPYFSVVSQGTCTLADTGSLAVTNAWQRAASGFFLYSALGVNPSMSRAHTGSWMVNPINDSVKLAVMRCVYRKSIEGCIGPSPDDCMNCDNLFYAYFNIVPPSGGSNTVPYPGGPSNNPCDPSNAPNGSTTPCLVSSVSSNLLTFTVAFNPLPPDHMYKGWSITANVGNNSTESRMISDSITATSGPTAGVTTFTVSPAFTNTPLLNNSQFTKLVPPPTLRPPISGIVTTDCLGFRPCWFCWGPKPPRGIWGSKCCRVGCYCGTYVWVPEEGVDELTKLVMLIDDIAYYEPPRTATSTVIVTGAAKSTGAPAPQVDDKGKPQVALPPATTTQVFTISTIPPRTPSALPYGVLGLQQTLQMAPQNVAPLIPQ